MLSGRTVGGLRRSKISWRGSAHFGLDRDTIHRWRKRLKSPANFDAENAWLRPISEAFARAGELACADLGVMKHRAIRMQPRAGLGPPAFREILPALRSVAQPRGAVSR